MGTPKLEYFLWTILDQNQNAHTLSLTASAIKLRRPLLAAESHDFLLKQILLQVLFAWLSS